MTWDLALFGPGDFSEWSDFIFEAAPIGHVALVSVGAAELGQSIIDQLRQQAVERIERVGRRASVVMGLTTAELDEEQSLRHLEGAGMLYLQGGNPRYIVDCLGPSRFWARARDADLSIVTTSGGAMAMGERCPDIRPGGSWGEGLRVVEHVNVAAHWDTFEARSPGFRAAFESETRGATTLVALDEESAFVRHGSTWAAAGPGKVHVKDAKGWRTYLDGAALDVGLG